MRNSRPILPLISLGFVLLPLLLLVVVLPPSCSSQCVSTGSRTCQDTGCRVNGGICNSVCICVSRSTNETESEWPGMGKCAAALHVQVAQPPRKSM
uniref:Secreted protein n=1 Tax=Globodera rostochiensis TaxID=31243 RepID=A0A914H799_GLORO